MGLGKTVQAICHLGKLHKDNEDSGPHLIVVPASTLENWTRELEIWCPFLAVVSYHGPAKHRMELQYQMQDAGCYPNVILTTYEICVNQSQDRRFLRRFPLSYLVMDEAHCIKSATSTRYKYLSLMPYKHTLLLTGTPIQNNFSELGALISFILPKSAQEIKWLQSLQKLDNAIEQSHVITRVRTMLGPFILRRLKAEVLDQLVAKKLQKEIVPQSEDQKQLYATIMTNTRKTLSEAKGQKEKKDNDVPESLADDNSSRSKRSNAPPKKMLPGKILNNLVMQLRKVTQEG